MNGEKIKAVVGYIALAIILLYFISLLSTIDTLVINF